MKLQRYNKSTAAVVAGAITTVVGAFMAVDAELLASVQTLLTAALVWFAPNAR